MSIFSNNSFGSEFISKNHFKESTCPSPTNVALNKPAQPAGQQGTTAGLAVDGNTNGNPWPSPQSVFISNWVNQPYWEVNLESVFDIETINIWNRTDDGSQLTNYYVLVSDNPFNSTDLYTTINQFGVSAYQQTVMAGFPTTININRTGKYVRVQRDAKSTGGGLISIAEVEVMSCLDGGCPSAGTPCDDGNSLTENDQEDGNCNCSGTPIEFSCSAPTNIAQGKVSTQSSTHQNGGVASRAIDGDTNGNHAGGSMSLTTNEIKPWWEVDLGRMYEVGIINVWNRTDWAIGYLNNYYVFVSALPFSSNDPNVLANDPNVISFFQDTQAERPTIINTGSISGRYVRVQLTAAGNQLLGLPEVEVIGCCPVVGTPCDDGNSLTENDQEDGNCNCSGTPVEFSCSTPTNIAQGEVSTQSSTHQNGAVASRAIDGDTNGNHAGGSMSLTTNEIKPWWEVDLGLVYEVGIINVWNRTDWAIGYLNNYYVFVSELPFSSTDPNVLATDPNVTSFFQDTQAERPTTINTGSISGRYVRVQLTAAGNQLLGLPEIEVMGCEKGGGAPQKGEGVFTELRKKLNGDYTVPSGQELNFVYKEDYAIVDGENDLLKYRIKNWRNKVVMNSTLANLYGANWQTLLLPDPPTVPSIDIPSLLPEFFYILEVDDVSKDETYYLRFQYYFMPELQVAGGGQTN